VALVPVASELPFSQMSLKRLKLLRFLPKSKVSLERLRLRFLPQSRPWMELKVKRRPTT
jgi:hypothetical protein